jgi:trehalose 6-phosphate synthase
MLWFIQHYLWDLSNAPDIRRHEVEAFEFGYNVVNEDLATAVLEEIEGEDEPVVMVHDYQLYTLPAMIRRARPDAFLHHFVHIPWTQSDAWRVPAHADPRRDLPRAAGQRHHRLPHALLPAQLPAVLPGPARRRGRHGARSWCACDDREVWVRAYPLPIDCTATQELSARDRVREFEDEAAAPPPRVLDPARRPRRPLQERPARVHRLRHLPRAASGVPRADHRSPRS